jgi:two-component system chemotaxis response regulator CheY
MSRTNVNPPDPAEPSARRQTRGPKSVASNSNGLGHVLVVDDDAAALETVRAVLQGTGGCHVVVAGSQDECLRQADEVAFDLILLDTTLPDIDPPHLVRCLRGRPWMRDVPILVVSADARPEQMAACFEAGANGFLIKPFDAGNLYQQVQQALARHRVRMLQKKPGR